MNSLFNIEKFISERITSRKESLLARDLKNYYNEIFGEVNNKNILVIGGAGTIGSSLSAGVIYSKILLIYLKDNIAILVFIWFALQPLIISLFKV